MIVWCGIKEVGMISLSVNGSKARNARKGRHLLIASLSCIRFECINTDADKVRPNTATQVLSGCNSVCVLTPDSFLVSVLLMEQSEMAMPSLLDSYGVFLREIKIAGLT